MTVPFVPHAFIDGENLDVEKVNDNLEAIAGQIRRNLGARYTYGPPMIFPLDGVAASDAAVLRQFAIRRPAAGRAVEIVGMEVVLYGSGAAGEAVLSCSDPAWPSITVDVVNSATTEVYGSSGVPVSVPSESSDVVFTLALPAGYTVTRGYLVIHTRCDRGHQGHAFDGYVPALLSSVTPDPPDHLDDEFAAAAAAVARDGAADRDLRGEIFAARSLTGGLSFNMPSGARRLLGVSCYLVASGGVTAFVEVDSASASAAGAGATSRAYGVDIAPATYSGDPMNLVQDIPAGIIVSSGTAALVYGIAWWD
jgi:hypothetical protein